MRHPMNAIRHTFQAIGAIFWMLVHTGEEMGDAVRRRRPAFPLRVFHQQAYRVGVGSVPLVALVCFFVGLTIALLTGHQLRSFGQERMVPVLVAIAFTRELGPLMTGIMLAARIGAAYTAELGTMTVAEEVEALEGMGIGALRYLVSPRVLAAVVLTPCLAVVGNVFALVGAALISLWAFHMAWEFFFTTVLDTLLIRDLVFGVFKSLLFGVIVGAVSCYKGLAVTGGAAGVGTAATASVVTSITAVIGFDTVFNVMVVALFEK